MHGSAPDIAGKGIANPTALLLAAAMMLEHVGKRDVARRLRTAIDTVLQKDAVRTGDLGGKATTKDITQAIVEFGWLTARPGRRADLPFGAKSRCAPWHPMAAISLEHSRLDVGRRAQVWFLESMDRIIRAIQSTTDVVRTMSDVLDELLAIFGCVRLRRNAVRPVRHRLQHFGDSVIRISSP